MSDKPGGHWPDCLFYKHSTRSNFYVDTNRNVSTNSQIYFGFLVLISRGGAVA